MTTTTRSLRRRATHAIGITALCAAAIGCRSAYNDRLALGRDVVLPAFHIETASPTSSSAPMPETSGHRFVVPVDSTVHANAWATRIPQHPEHPRQSGEMPTVLSALDASPTHPPLSLHALFAPITEAATQTVVVPIRAAASIRASASSSPAGAYRRTRQSGWHPIVLASPDASEIQASNETASPNTGTDRDAK